MSDDLLAKTGRRMLLFVWFLFFGLLLLFFYYYEQAPKSVIEIQSGTVTIKSDRQGHYWLNGSINGKSVKLMIDTGATLMAIPGGMADKLGLVRYYPITMDTANGQAQGVLTRLNSLSFAGFTFENVKAVIMPNSQDETVLLGMNVLSQFDMKQQGGDLVLSKNR